MSIKLISPDIKIAARPNFYDIPYPDEKNVVLAINGPIIGSMNKMIASMLKLTPFENRTLGVNLNNHISDVLFDEKDSCVSLHDFFSVNHMLKNRKLTPFDVCHDVMNAQGVHGGGTIKGVIKIDDVFWFCIDDVIDINFVKRTKFFVAYHPITGVAAIFSFGYVMNYQTKGWRAIAPDMTAVWCYIGNRNKYIEIEYNCFMSAGMSIDVDKQSPNRYSGHVVTAQSIRHSYKWIPKEK